LPIEPVAFKHQLVHHQSGRDTAGHHIGQRIELQSERTENLEQAREKSVKKIKKDAQSHKPEGHFKTPVEGKNECNAATE
jgi:hypothetical protein